ncbi:MAG TPA: GAF and ANTAR domain-containing protein [Kribbella sp.]
MTRSLSDVRRDSDGRDSARTFADLALQLHDLSTAETVDAVLQFAIRAAGCTCAAVALLDEDGLLTIGGVSQAMPAELCRSQIVENDGPLVEAVRYGVVVHVARVRTEARWPAWSSRTLASGLASAIYAPLRFRNSVLGVLALYSPLDDGFPDNAVAVARALACHASVAVSSARRREQLSKATELRSLIGRATGILMERHAVDADEAFAILRDHAVAAGLEVHTVAAELVATRRG